MKLIIAAILFATSLCANATPAVEYYHAGFNHYFITANQAEISNLDGGAFGGAWKRTGESFQVNATQQGGMVPVCRFFSASFAPLSSHFYTPSAEECTGVKSNRNWDYEGIAFSVRTHFAGQCNQTERKVYRLYNNGQGGSPNHRYTTSETTRNKMIQQGWVSEGYGPDGVTFCTIPAVEDTGYAMATRVLGGSWYVTYSFGGSFTERLTFTSVYRNTGTSADTLDFLIEGIGPFSKPLGGGYSVKNDLYVAVWRYDSGNWNGYAFELMSDNSLKGCYDFVLSANSSQLLARCATMTGFRSPVKMGVTSEDAPAHSEEDQEAAKLTFDKQ